MSCKYCGGTGLIPFKNKQGQLRNDAFIDCICKDEPYHHLDICPDDFDFPMSLDCRERTFEQYGRPWERRHEIHQPEEPTVPRLEADPMDIQIEARWTQRQQNQIDQARAEVRRLTYKVAALTGEQPTPEKTKYQGLVVK